MIHSMSDPSLSFDFDLVITSLPASNQKQALRLIALEVSKIIGINDRILSDRFVEKEKKSSSAIGNGIALMHLQMSGLQKPLNVFVRLKAAIAMNTPDNKDVDIICLLLTPERDGTTYLQSLARLSRFLKDEKVAGNLRKADGEMSIRAILETSPSKRMAA